MTTTHAAKSAFIAGGTSFTGRAVAHQDADAHGVDLKLQVRPGSKNKALLDDDPRICEVALDDHDGLVAAMQGCDCVVQLIGTVMARFNEDGDYEAVDYGTTVQLVAAAKAAGVPHFALLSSVGAGTGMGPYLSWKKKTEQHVKDSGLGYTLVRPSYLAGDDVFTDRKKLTNTTAFLGGMSDSPLGAPFAIIRPIPIQGLARAFLLLVHDGPVNGVLTGQQLFRVVRKADDHFNS